MVFCVSLGETLSHVFRRSGWESFVLLHGTGEPWTLYEPAVRAAMAKTSVRLFAYHHVNATMSENTLVSLFNQIKRDTQGNVVATPFFVNGHCQTDVSLFI